VSKDGHSSSRAELVAEDSGSRQLAQTCFDRPLVLEAGAGTGKTTALVSRIVVWVLGAGWDKAARRLRAPETGEPLPYDRIAAAALQRVVAITFTEAAAAEMARRVGETLAELATGAIPSVLYAPALPSDETERRMRARALVGALDRLVVRTIHAFARRLLAAHPVEAGLHPAFAVDADGSGAATIVRELLEQRLRDAYGEPGDPVWLGLAARGVTAARLEEDLLELLESSTPAAFLAEDPFEATRLEALRSRLSSGLERLLSLAAPRLEGKSRVYAAGDLLTRAGEAANRLRAPATGGVSGIEALQSIAREHLAPRLDLLSKWAKGTFTKTEASLLGAEVHEELATLASALWGDVEYLCELDAHRLDLGRRALAPLLAEAAEALRVRGLLGYDALVRGAAQLLEVDAGVCSRERAQIDQLLVDEFQDTDALQCAIVAALGLGASSKEGPGLFLVGDPKQSIYGWRGADLGAYDAFVARVVAEGGQRRALCVNHRSLQAILDEVERVIRPAMHEQHGVQPCFQPLVADRAGEDHQGAPAPVEYWVSRKLRERDDELATRKPEATTLEARALARDVARLLREEGVEPRNVGILLRGFGDVEACLSALREADVPYAVARDRSYYRRREVIDASCLVRCVVDPADTLAFVAFLRSSAVGVPDAALLPLWRQQLPSLVSRLPRDAERTLGEIRRAVKTAAREIPSDVPGIETVSGWEHALLFALEAVCALRLSFESDSSDVFVERLRAALLFEAIESARPLGAFRVANLERFFRELAAALADGGDATEVLRQLRRNAREGRDAEEARPLESAEQAVQVMTIHKAKGLAFHHTYVVQLHKESGGRGFVAPPPRAVAHEGLIELRLLGETSPGFRRMEAREKESAEAEEVRTLYVAMTRARDRLVLAGLWPEEDSSTSVEKSPLAFLRERDGGVPPLDDVMRELRDTARGDRAERNGALWIFPALHESATAMAPAESDADAASAAARAGNAEVDARRIAGWRAGAARRQARRLGAPASQAAHEAMRELFESRREAERGDNARATRPERAGFGRAIATAVGSAVHRALELLDLEAAPAEALAGARETVEATLKTQLVGDELAKARERADEILERFQSGALLGRLRELGPRILARELPVLLPPTDASDGPVGYLAGAIDLVYLDPVTDEPVVADYKTDGVETQAEIDELCARYALQGAQYVRAVREAFGLARDPRFELWFLQAGRAEAVLRNVGG
jgi:ATP-dependent helicase/nuclease subunit A